MTSVAQKSLPRVNGDFYHISATLSEEDQALLRLYALAEPYKNVSELLRMKTGSIGPTLGRSLARLRQTRALRRYLGTRPAAENQEGGDQLELAPMDR